MHVLVTGTLCCDRARTRWSLRVNNPCELLQCACSAMAGQTCSNRHGVVRVLPCNSSARKLWTTFHIHERTWGFRMRRG